MLKIPGYLDNAFFIMTRADEEKKEEREVSFSRILNASFPVEADRIVVVKALRTLHKVS